jgi:S-disulfanyl-L-cysteine oxidoreductase SoxD
MCIRSADLRRAAPSPAPQSPSKTGVNALEVGAGRGGGSGGCRQNVPHSPTPTPDPSPQGGGEKKKKECPARWSAFAALAAFTTLVATDCASAQGYPATFSFGAPASAADIAAVAIAIGSDGKGLPAGKGDYAAGKRVYEASCIACHGDKLQGVAGLKDMPAGAALRLIGGRGTLTTKDPVMTVESYWPYATTLFDYVRRAMPFTAPGSLSADEVYAVAAYILGEANIIDKTMVVDAETLPRVRMPNRDGFIPDPRPEWFK